MSCKCWLLLLCCQLHPKYRGSHEHLNALQGSRGRLSRELIALWSDGYDPALNLLNRILLPGLLRYLQQRKPQVAPNPAAGSAAALAMVVFSSILPSKHFVLTMLSASFMPILLACYHALRHFWHLDSQAKLLKIPIYACLVYVEKLYVISVTSNIEKFWLCLRQCSILVPHRLNLFLAMQPAAGTINASSLQVKTADGIDKAAESASQQSDPGNLISPDPRKAPAQPLSPRANSAAPAGDASEPSADNPSKPMAIPCTKDSPQTVALNATAEGSALPVIGSPEQYLLRARNLPPRPGTSTLHPFKLWSCFSFLQ